ncbi:MAG: TraI domain-containing protein [Rhodocyclaceae bacterium]|nr:TraI domain-containing protein [Rhodocyclaceae bacterium]MBX3669857.1 TraI domain-containing protein [Rhodocyclaceae bacterium]
MQDAASLLQPHAERVDAIKLELRVSAEVCERHYLPLIERYAEFVQRLPASESHHHAEPGGLLLHAIETAAYALRARRSSLVQGAMAEDQARLQHVFTWCVLAGALLHDVAKPLTDLRVMWWPGTDAEAAPWSPLAGSLPALGAFEYRVEFCASRQYAEHRTLALALLQRFVPDSTLAWVAGAPAQLQDLSALLQGDGRGVLADLIQAGDRASVRENLQSGSRVRFASARNVPLIERLMAGLRRMLAEGLLPLNRSGACAWVHGEDMWFVAGRVADELRAYLARTETAPAGMPGPDKNDRLFDCWQDYGACIATPEGRAVWRVRITGPDYAHELTCLRFPLAKLFETPAQYPAAMLGGVVPLNGVVAGQLAAAVAPLECGDTQAASASCADHTAGTTQVEPASVTPIRECAGTAGARVESTPQASVPPDEDDGLLNAEDCATAHLTPARTAPSLTQAVAPLLGDACVADNIPLLAQRFMGWLQQGLAGGTIAYNQAQGLVHFVSEGMFLVSPRAFVAFIADCGALGDAKTADEPERKSINRLQGALSKAGWALSAGRGNSIHKMQTLRRGQRGAVLCGVIVPQPERFVNPVPPANALLVPYVEGAPAGASA